MNSNEVLILLVILLISLSILTAFFSIYVFNKGINATNYIISSVNSLCP